MRELLGEFVSDTNEEIKFEDFLKVSPLKFFLFGVQFVVKKISQSLTLVT